MSILAGSLTVLSPLNLAILHTEPENTRTLAATSTGTKVAPEAASHGAPNGRMCGTGGGIPLASAT